MNLIVDGGNTSIKVALFQDYNLQGQWGCQSETELKERLQKLPGWEKVIYANVGSWELSFLRESHSAIELTPQTPVPFCNEYQSLETMGVDRQALVVAAFSEFSGQNVLVIDAGTCITYDFLQKDGIYKGGVISPGLAMRYRSMHNYTSRLPLVDRYDEAPLTGTDTQSSLHSGVINGAKAEVGQIIEWYDQRFSHLRVVISGGSAKVFADLEKNSIFVAPDFLLRGLNYILIHNE